MVTLPLNAMVLAFWAAFIAGAVGAGPILKALIAMKSRQTVSTFAPEGHQVKQGTPTMGGLIVVLGGIVGEVALLVTHRQAGNLPVGGLLLFLGFALIGFVDDYVVPRKFKGKRGLGWKQKILMQIVIGGGVAWYLFGANSIALWATLLILFFSNAYNFADGLDALAGTLLVGLASGLTVMAFLLPGQSEVALLLAPLMGAILPFLYLNAPPAKVFMGDVGSLAIGAILGLVVSLIGGLKPVVQYGTMGVGPYARLDFGDDATYRFDTVSVGGPIVWLALAIVSLVMVAELVPVPLQIFWVKAFKKRLFPFTPIHHAFEKAGWKETRVVGAFALAQLVLAMLAASVLVLASSGDGERVSMIDGAKARQLQTSPPPTPSSFSTSSKTRRGLS